MAITVEDGAGVTGANSYASVAELNAYATHRLDVSGYSDAKKESALVIASSDWLDGQHELRGEPLSESQGLHFPTDIDGFPTDIKTAALKAALLQLQGLLLVDLASINQTGVVESETKELGPLKKSVKYATAVAQKSTRMLPADLTNLLKPYAATSGGMGVTYRL